MAGARLFSGGPVGQTLSPQEFVNSALSQPLGLGEQLSSSFVQGALDSPLLGSAIRETYAPDRVRPGMVWDPNLGQGRWETTDEIAERTDFERDALLDEEQYKGSEWFREQIPWKLGMTVNRAKALAEMADAKDVRQFYAAKRPVTAFFGGLAGAATDPVNYIPVVGPTVRAATAARLGVVRAAALTASADAVANTAIALTATAPIRSQFGDDISFEAFAQDLAMAAIIGGAFGTIAGAIGKRADSRLIAKANEELGTAETLQKGTVVLNDAIDGLVRNDRVDLSTSSLTFGDSVSNMALRMDLEMRPRDVIDANARAADPQTFARLEDVDRLIQVNEAQLQRLNTLNAQPENTPLRADLQKLDDLNAQYEDLTARAAAEANEANAQAMQDRANRIGREIAETASRMDEGAVERLEFNEREAANRRQQIDSLRQERETLVERADQAKTKSETDYWKETKEDRLAAEERAELYRLFPDVQDQIIDRPGLKSGDDVMEQAATKPVSRYRTQTDPDPATQPVDQPETPPQAAEQRNVTEDGNYREEPEIADLRERGLLTPEDEASLAEADEAFTKEESFARTMERMVACLF